MTVSSDVDARFAEHRIQGVEMLVSDMASLPRGRVVFAAYANSCRRLLNYCTSPVNLE